MREAGSGARDGAREWRADDAPPLGLLRLREAGIVRLCGLAAASRGLDLAARRALSQLRRDGARLSALVGADEPVEAWIATLETPEPVESLTLAAMRWGCAAHTPDAPATPGVPGCEHVAAVLSAWVRAPGDFRTPAAPQEAPPAPAPPTSNIPPSAPVGPPIPTKPPRPGPRAPASLADELHHLSERELAALARRTLGNDASTPARTAEETLAALETTLSDADALARLLARLEPDARELLAWLRLAGGALTIAGLDALATRSGKPVSALRGVLATLERHALLFPNLLPDTVARPARRAARALLARRLRLAHRAGDPRRLAARAPHPATRLRRDDGGAPARRKSVATGAAAGAGAAATRARAARPAASIPRPGRHRQRRARASVGRGATLPRARVGVALTPEDLPEAALLAAARSAGLSPDAARLARRITLWARDWDGAAGGASFASNATTPGAQPPTGCARIRRRSRSGARPAHPPISVDLERATGTVRMRYDHTHEAFRPAALADEAAAARGWVTRLLGLAAPGAWYRMDDLIELIWRVNPYFLRGKQLAWRMPVWRLERVADGRPLRPTIREEWDAAEGAYLRALLAGPLHLWGALDLAVAGSGTPRTLPPHAARERAAGPNTAPTRRRRLVRWLAPLPRRSRLTGVQWRR